MFSRLSRLFALPASPKKNALRSWYHPKIEVLEDRLAPATFAWTNGAGTGVFSNAANWANALTGAAGTPGNGDSLVFPLAAGVTPGTVTDDLAGTTTFASITFLSAGWTLDANAGSTVGVTSAINDTTNTTGTNIINAPLDFTAATSSVGINVVNPSAAGGTALSFGGPSILLGNAGFTYTGFGNVGIAAFVNGPGGIVANSSGTLTLSNANNFFTGSTTVNSGIVNAIGFPNVLGTGTVTVNNGGTLSVGVSGLTNALNLNGFGFGGNGALVDNVGAFAVYGGNITLQSDSSINIASANNFALSGNASETATGTISGPGGLTIVSGSNGDITDEDAGSYTGVTNVIGANLILFSNTGQTGSGGQNTGTSGYVVTQGGSLSTENEDIVTNNRFGMNAFIELDGGSLLFNNNGVAGAGVDTETFAALNFGPINNTGTVFGTDTVHFGSSGRTTVNVTTITRTVGSTVNFTDSSGKFGTGMASGDNLTPTGAAGPPVIPVFGTGAGLVNGILPYANVNNNGATSFVTDVTPGTTPLSVAAPTTTINAGGMFPIDTSGTGNYLLTGNISVLLQQDTFINSLALVGGADLELGGHTLQLASGAILTEDTTAEVIGNGVPGGQLKFAGGSLASPSPVEGIIQNPAGSLQIGAGIGVDTAPITAGTDLTLAVTTLKFAGSNTANSTYTGTTFLTGGTIQTFSTVTNNTIPTPLVIGSGGSAATVSILGNAQQLSGPTGPDNVTINPNGLLNFSGGVTQTIGALRLNSGLKAATLSVGSANNTLTVTGSVTSGGVALSPTSGLPGNAIPIVTGFQPSQITGSGTLQLAASGTEIFNVGQTPALIAGSNNGAAGEEDLFISAVLGTSIATLDKTGTGVLILGTMPAFTGLIQIDGGTFGSSFGSLSNGIQVDSGGTLGNSNSTTTTLTTGSITVDGGTVNPGLPPSPLTPAQSNADYLNQGTATTPNFSAGGILDLHVDGYGTTTDWDQFQGTNANGLQVTLGGTSLLDVDLLGLAEWGTLTGAAVNGPGASPFLWQGQLIGKFSNAPNGTGTNILPAANLANNPTGFQALVSYGMGFLTVVLAHPSTVTGSTYTAGQGTALTVSTAANGILGTGLVSNPDFGNATGTSNGIVSFVALTTIQNPGTFTGSAGGTLVVNADGTFTYTPKASFSGTETFSLNATDPRGTRSAAFTVTFDVIAPTPPPPPPPVTTVFYYAVGSGEGIPAEVKVYNAATGSLAYDLHPFGSFSGGVRVAVGDVNGDGTPDIIAGAGPGGGPQVVVYDGTTGQIIRSFYGLASGFTGGVFVAAGDINADGFADVIVGADAGGGPQVAVFSGKDGSLLQSFYALSPSFSGGVRVAAGDVNGDGRTDIVAAAGPGVCRR